MDINAAMMFNNWPTLDLHGYDRETARVEINDFIRDSLIQGYEYIIIVHGKGTGIVREATRKALSCNKQVIEFKSNYFNDGATIVHLQKR